MIFHENRLLADSFHVNSYLIFVENWEKMSQNLLSAAVEIGVSLGADPGFFERGFISFKLWRFALLIISNFP